MTQETTHRAPPADVDRLRGYLLRCLEIDLSVDGFERSDLLAVLSPIPAESAWRDYRLVTAPKDGTWFLWRDPSGPERRVHADQAIVEAGKITGKFGCGLDFYTECAPLVMPADVARIMEARRNA